MFSMKYTSPKVTPKKGVSPPPPLPLLPSGSSSVCAAALSATAFASSSHRLDSYATSTEKYGGVNRVRNGLLHGEGEFRSPPPRKKHSKRNDDDDESITAAARRLPATLSARLLPMTDANTTAMSEHDSAVADILSEEAEELPSRTTLLSLLEREYADAAIGNASGSPGEKARNTDADDERIATGGGMERSAGAIDGIEGGRAAMAEDVTGENQGVGRDPPSRREDSMESVHVQELSPFISLQPAHSSRETPTGSCEFRRSFSTELLVGGVHSPDEEAAVKAPSASVTATAISAVAVEESANVGHARSFRGCDSSGSSEEIRDNDEGDAQSVAPSLDEPRSPRSPTIYDISASQDTSPMMSEINTDRRRSYDEPILHSESYAATESDYHVGGDTYFVEKMRTADNSVDDEFVHVTLPPRVNRTTATGKTHNDHGSAPFMPDCPPSPSATSPLFPNRSPIYPMSPGQPLSPRQPFSHTHSLLDDCSDDDEEEEEAPALHIVVDHPTRHSSSYSCLPRGGSSFSYARFTPQHKPGSCRHHARHPRPAPAGTPCSATQVATHNIRHALLQTRHRRWDCQSAYAGAHAQSSRVFDVSTRFYHLDRGYIPCERGARGDVGAPLPLASRLSVSAAAVRAAARGSGLWRTARLVRLPRGLFRAHLSEREEEGLSAVRQHEVRALLTMLDATFSVLDQLDFGGDFSRLSCVANDTDDDWRNNILSFIMKCLPRVVAIDGILVERDSINLTAERASRSTPESTGRQNEASNLGNRRSDRRRRETHNPIENSAPCDECDSVPVSGFSDLVGGEAERRRSSNPPASCATAAQDRDSHDHAEAIASVAGPGQCDTVDVSAGACGSTRENALAIKGQPDDMHKIPALSSSSSMLSSSWSWGSNGSGARPPTCPMSASRQRSLRLPSKPAARKKTKDRTFTKTSGLKRRVLGLIPAVSMMDEDEDSDDSEETVENDCPTDLL